MPMSGLPQEQFLSFPSDWAMFPFLSSFVIFQDLNIEQYHMATLEIRLFLLRYCFCCLFPVSTVTSKLFLQDLDSLLCVVVEFLLPLFPVSLWPDRDFLNCWTSAMSLFTKCAPGYYDWSPPQVPRFLIPRSPNLTFISLERLKLEASYSAIFCCKHY
jgi:hypothetical protein